MIVLLSYSNDQYTNTAIIDIARMLKLSRHVMAGSVSTKQGTIIHYQCWYLDNLRMNWVNGERVLDMVAISILVNESKNDYWRL